MSSTDTQTRSRENLSVAEREAIAYLRSPRAIRDRCHQLFALALEDRLEHFRCDLTQLDHVANYVIQVMLKAYPDLNVPFHSRWRHFEAGGVPRSAWLHQPLKAGDPVETARTQFDLVILSVLLDAGAGDRWQYVEADTGQVFGRSEGLAVASIHMFCQGLFSSNTRQPWQADAAGLRSLSEADLASGFQARSDNPLVGIQGRWQLLQRLGTTLGNYPHLFGKEQPRPGGLVDYLLKQAVNHQLAAEQVFSAVLEGLSEIWPGRTAIANINLGDVWTHPALADAGIGTQLVPFHKLSQWLTYSLLEPLQELGIEITGLNTLTGLPEYRNGGLCLDLGLIQPKQADITATRHRPSSSVIVEWRALTVILLDHIASTIRQQLNLSEAELPLVKVLEGGTWAAGRKIAAERRSGGVPPIQIESDGTVF
ncbi:URC4/urg3 family protein [Oculatella sp. LEGE 06141]|uniref:URC4/urg3 family protein n=1 Tax=Oculatella sp. LEGE 06141 TaxID=1828648 RepID=UPI0030D87C49